LSHLSTGYCADLTSRRRTILALAVTACALGACGWSTPAQRAEQSYAIVEKDGTYEEKCVAARKVADLYLETIEEEKYREWKLTADTDCLSAATALL
jgi:hypothetical protein